MKLTISTKRVVELVGFNGAAVKRSLTMQSLYSSSVQEGDRVLTVNIFLNMEDKISRHQRTKNRHWKMKQTYRLHFGILLKTNSKYDYLRWPRKIKYNSTSKRTEAYICHCRYNECWLKIQKRLTCTYNKRLMINAISVYLFIMHVKYSQIVPQDIIVTCCSFTIF